MINKKLLLVFFIALTLICCTIVSAESSENLTTTAKGSVNGGFYSHAVQDPSYSSQQSGDNEASVSFDITKDERKYNTDSQSNDQTNEKSFSNSNESIKNVEYGRLYTMIYVQNTNDEISSYVNVSLDGDNDGTFEVELEKNTLLNITSSRDNSVYRVNDNITRVYSDYLLSYDIAQYIKSNEIKVNVHATSAAGSSDSKIKMVGLVAAYNVEESDKIIDYIVNTGHARTNTNMTTSLNFDNEITSENKKAILTQVASSSVKADTKFNNKLLNVSTPVGYFSENTWDVTEVCLKDNVLFNVPGGGDFGSTYKTVLATLEVRTDSKPDKADITVDGVTFTKTQNTVLAYYDTNLTVALCNNGAQCSEANIILTVGDESQTKTVTNVGNEPVNVIFEEYFTSTGGKDVSVVIDYLNGTSVTAYTGSVNIVASGYMGKSFSHGTNMTVRPVYEGYNTLNVFGHFFGYKTQNNPASFVFDAGLNGLVDEDKLVDIFYYQPWGIWDGQDVSITLSLNNKSVNILSSYKDQKGFGSYNFPYGLNVYNITDDFVCGAVNNFTVTPIPPVSSNAYAYLYGGYIVAIYANNTNCTVISVAEDNDALSAASTSSYGATSDTAIAYAQHNGVGMDNLSSAYLVAVANNAGASDENLLLFNGNNYGNMGTAYNGTSQVAIFTADVTKDIAEDNVMAIQCIKDSSVYVLSSILVATYEEQVPVITVNNLTASTYSGSLLALENNTIKVNLTSDIDVTKPLQVKLIIGNYEASQDVNPFSADTGAEVVFENYCPGTAGDVDVSVVIDYLNDTQVTAYTGSMTVYYNGYMGKSFTNNSNMTNAAVYEGNNTVNVFGVSKYISSNWAEQTFTFDAASNGIVDSNKVVDVLYYVPYTYSKGLNFSVTVNDEEISTKSAYIDEKGFGSWNYPYGLMVYNLTGVFKANSENSIVLTPGDSNNNGLYGTYLVVVYANSTGRSTIIISEDCDMLSTTSSSYGATSDTAISYANYDNINLTYSIGSNLIVIAGGADNTVNVLFNDENLGLLGTVYNGTTQLSIFDAELANLAANNNLAIQSINDNLYAFNAILVINYQEPQITIEPAEIEIDDNVTLKVSLVDSIGEINEGKVIFRINGKTLRDEKGNVIYADVVGGVATLPDVNVTSEWMKPNTTIQAIYTGTDTIEPVISDSIAVNVTNKEATVLINGDLQAKAGENVTLSANVTDKNGNVNTGHVAFKLNGKTLKDADGKALYVDVVNGVASKVYMLPAKTKTKTYTLTAVFTDTNYERAEDSNNFDVS